MLAGEPPFDGVDAVFVSHIHGDHFSAQPTITYLRAQPDVVLFASIQVYEAIAAALKESERSLLQRVTAIDLDPGDTPQRIEHGAPAIGVTAIPHAGGRRHAAIDNLAFRVSLAGAPTVLHLGDADADDWHFQPLQAFWAEVPLDAVFPPYWFLDQGDGPSILRQRLQARQVIGIHVPARAAGNGEHWRIRYAGDLFTDPGETRTLGTGKP